LHMDAVLSVVDRLGSESALGTECYPGTQAADPVGNIATY
jgi:hypothetical protein